MTPKQKEVFDFVLRFWKAYGYGPTYQDIADGVNVRSRSTVHRFVVRLCEQKVLRKSPKGKRKSRSVQPYDMKVLDLVVLGGASPPPKEKATWERPSP